MSIHFVSWLYLLLLEFGPYQSNSTMGLRRKKIVKKTINCSCLYLLSYWLWNGPVYKIGFWLITSIQVVGKLPIQVHRYRLYHTNIALFTMAIRFQILILILWISQLYSQLSDPPPEHFLEAKVNILLANFSTLRLNKNSFKNDNNFRNFANALNAFQ